METAVVAVVVTVVGLLVGSFLNVVILRVPEGRSVVRPPSECPRCGHRLRAREMIPVVSWLVQRGRCSACGERISAQYPLVEAGNAVLWLVTYLVFDLTWDFAMLAALFSGLLALAVVDLRTLRLPIPMVYWTAAITVSIALGGAVSLDEWERVIVAVMAGVLSFLFYGAVYQGSIIFMGKQGMGLGDVRLAPVIGFALGWVDWSMALMAVIGAVLSGAVISMVLMAVGKARGGTRIPFGVFMACGAVLAAFFGPAFVDWYASTSR